MLFHFSLTRLSDGMFGLLFKARISEEHSSVSGLNPTESRTYDSNNFEEHSISNFVKLSILTFGWFLGGA